MQFQFDVNGDSVNGIIVNFRYDVNDLIGLATIETQFGEIEIETSYQPWGIEGYLRGVPYSFLRGETKNFEIRLDTTSSITKSEIDDILAYYQAFVDIQDWELLMFAKVLIVTGTISEDYRKFAGFIKV